MIAFPRMTPRAYEQEASPRKVNVVPCRGYKAGLQSRAGRQFSDIMPVSEVSTATIIGHFRLSGMPLRTVRQLAGGRIAGRTSYIVRDPSRLLP